MKNRQGREKGLLLFSITKDGFGKQKGVEAAG